MSITLPKITALASRFDEVRARTVALAAPLSAEDQCVQSMPDASPVKWHLAHTSWFFEAVVLVPHMAGYRPFQWQLCSFSIPITRRWARAMPGPSAVCSRGRRWTRSTPTAPMWMPPCAASSSPRRARPGPPPRRWWNWG